MDEKESDNSSTTKEEKLKRQRHNGSQTDGDLNNAVGENSQDGAPTVWQKGVNKK